MHITWGGILFLAIIGLVIVAIIVFRMWRAGKSISISNIKPGNVFKKDDTNLVECFNVYRDKIELTRMKKDAIAKDAANWSFGMRQVYGQVYDKAFSGMRISDDVMYPPERVARMMGCIPLRKLKSLKFTLLEQLAPFAPVVALLICSFIYLIMK